MKIKVLKDNGLLEVGKTYEAYREQGFVRIGGMRLENEKFNEWLKNGYIEEVKEVSYAFEDFSKTLSFSPCLELEVKTLCATEKQASQANAFAKLTHVRAEILEDFNLENYDYKANTFYTVIADSAGQIRPIQCLSNEVYGLELRFPTLETAELALQHNQELFKTYLGV